MVQAIRCTALLILFAACSQDDGPRFDASLTGEWVLQKAVCFCFFGEDYDFSVHRLNFKTEAREVEVENGGGDIFFIAQNGNYPYTVQGGHIKLFDKSYTYEIQGDSLIMNFVDQPEIADDEISLYYSRAKD